VINFDSLPAAGLSGGLSGPLVTDYLASFGVTLRVSPRARRSRSTTPAPSSQARWSFRLRLTTSSPNPDRATPSPTPSTSPSPQDHFSMTRTAIHPGSTGDAYPLWSRIGLRRIGHPARDCRRARAKLLQRPGGQGFHIRRAGHQECPHRVRQPAFRSLRLRHPRRLHDFHAGYRSRALEPGPRCLWMRRDYWPPGDKTTSIGLLSIRAGVVPGSSALVNPNACRAGPKPGVLRCIHLSGWGLTPSGR